MSIKNKYHYKSWKPEYSDNVILQDAYVDMRQYITASQKDIPFIVQLIENPKYDFLRFGCLKGSTYIETHDLLHIILKQNMHMSGEAYVIGFTMGTTKKITKLDIFIFSIFSKYFYPKVFSFNDDELRVFKQGVIDGELSSAKNLHNISSKDLLNKSLFEIRNILNLSIGI